METRPRRNLTKKIAEAILYGRFEPIETILATMFIIVGIFIILPFNPVLTDADHDYLFFTNKTRYQMGGVVYAILGTANLLGVWLSDLRRRNTWYNIRKNALFLMSIVAVYTTMEIALDIGIAHPRWIVYLAISLITGVTYLALVVQE